jgi:hypothetical protein
MSILSSFRLISMPTLTPATRHLRRTSLAVTGLEAGAVLFVLGLTLLYLNPFWHFDNRGMLDPRLHWWNGVGEFLIASGMAVEAAALVSALAALISRFTGRDRWPYYLALLLVVGVAVWILPLGFVCDLDAHFEWNSADGFATFRVQDWDQSAQTWRPSDTSALSQWVVEIQIQPLLRGYFSLNDWDKMNGELNIKVARIIPIAWPVDLGSGGETLEDPDETALMRASVAGDLKTVQEQLAASPAANVNELDQGGQSALILACQTPRPSPKVVQALIAAGANVNLRARNGYTALGWALSCNNTELTRLLRTAGARR